MQDAILQYQRDRDPRDPLLAYGRCLAHFAVEPFADVWRATIGSEPPASADGSNESLLLTPGSHATDGFSITILRRRS